MTTKYKVALVTGATRGIGLATADLFAHNGIKTYGTFRAESNVDSLDTAIKGSKGMFVKIELDVTDSLSIRSAITKILESEKRIDIVVNNACDVVIGTIESCTLDQQIRSMDVNYFGVVRLLKEVLPTMRSQKSGRIINLSSIAGVDPYPPIETYAVTKFAIEGLTESLATNLSPWGIKCSLIEPGGVKTLAPEKADRGKEILEENPYSEYANQSQRLMIESYDKGALDPREVAKLILSVIESPSPHLRYQCGTFAVDIAKKRFIDPTGDAPVNEKKKMLEDLGLYQLIGKRE